MLVGAQAALGAQVAGDDADRVERRPVQRGQVLRPDGTAIEGLYAAGRGAAGLCSRSYVSGLSLADCVFSGRHAGRHAAHAPAPPPVPSARNATTPM